MPRKQATITIDAQGRDIGKTFLLTEMPASKAERWAMRALLSIAKSGIDIPDDVKNAGMAGLASVGVKALGQIGFDDAIALMDEMFECVKIVPDPNKPEVTRGLIEDDIEEVSTRLRLRKELFALHVNFSIPAAQ